MRTIRIPSVALTFDKLEDTALFGAPEFAQWHELWQARLGRQQESKAARHQLMRSSNPALIPRNHRVEAALEAAVKQGDYSVMERLLEVLSNPYAHSAEQAEYATLVSSNPLTERIAGHDAIIIALHRDGKTGKERGFSPCRFLF